MSLILEFGNAISQLKCRRLELGTMQLIQQLDWSLIESGDFVGFVVVVDETFDA